MITRNQMPKQMTTPQKRKPKPKPSKKRRPCSMTNP